MYADIASNFPASMKYKANDVLQLTQLRGDYNQGWTIVR